jgi:DNA-directed RNA polymerase beta subunit
MSAVVPPVLPRCGNMADNKGKDKYWPVIEAFFDYFGLVGQHLDSFNRFVREELQEVVNSIAQLNPKVEGYTVQLGRITVEAPTVREADGSEHSLYPNEARIRNFFFMICQKKS